MTTGKVVKIQRFSVNDGDGIRTTVFLEGCPLKCRWCSNPDSWNGIIKLGVSKERCINCKKCIDLCPNKITSLFNRNEINNKCNLCGKCISICPQSAITKMTDEMTINQVIELIEKDFIFFSKSGGGITFSGGEPTIQVVFLRELVNHFYYKGIHTSIETCGVFNFDKCRDIFEKIDHIFIDIKNMNSEQHKEFTGLGNELILKNIKYLATLNKSMVIRVPVIPGFNDDLNNIKNTALFAKENLKTPKIELLPYHMFGIDKYKDLGLDEFIYKYEIPSSQHMNYLADVVRNCGVEIVNYK